MKLRIILFIVLVSQIAFAQTKSKNLKLKYTLPAGWNAEEFGGKSPWEEPGNAICHCSGVLFSRSHKDGKMKVVVYPSTQSGLDSAKRNMVGPLRFEDVAKVDNVRNNGLSFQRKKSNFTDTLTGKKSFEAFRYYTKVDDHFYIIFAWQENMQPLNSTNEKEVLQMVNAIEAN